MKNSFINTGLSKFLIIAGAVVFALAIIIFIWREPMLNFGSPIDKQIFGLFGDFVSGLVGSIWALAGVILFYVALSEQRRDFETNRDALKTQMQSLNLQSYEFKNQQQELAMSREISREQNITMKKQQFDATFFSFLQLRAEIVKSLPKKNSASDYFQTQKTALLQEFNSKASVEERHITAVEHYTTFYYGHKEELSHYYRSIYRIIRFVDDSDLNEKDKYLYAKIFRSQLTESELFFLFYNAQTPYGGNFRQLILKYNLLKHLPIISKLEFKTFATNGDNRIEAQRLYFCEKLNALLIEFLRNTKENRLEILAGVPEEVSLRFEPTSPIYSLFADSLSHFKFSVHIDEKDTYHEGQLGLPELEFEDFIRRIFYDMLTFSRFKKHRSLEVGSRRITQKLEFSLNCDDGFDISVDTY